MILTEKNAKHVNITSVGDRTDGDSAKWPRRRRLVTHPTQSSRRECKARRLRFVRSVYSRACRRQHLSNKQC